MCGSHVDFVVALMGVSAAVVARLRFVSGENNRTSQGTTAMDYLENTPPYRSSGEPLPSKMELTYAEMVRAFELHRLGLIGRDGTSKSGSQELPESNLLLQFNYDVE
jgi:hypothetical protein